MHRGDFITRLKEERILLPPLAGYTDYPFRRVLADFGAPFMCTEMVSCDAVVRHNERTERMLKKPTGNHMHGAQIFGDDPALMAEAAKIIESDGFDYVDINMGCAVKKVTQNGAGVSLMGDPEKAYEVVSAIVDAVSIPVTCKMRLGETRDELNAPELSKVLEEADVAAVTVHGRSGEKKFGEPVNHDAIREVVESVNIPVVGNGGVFGVVDAVVMMKTGVDAVMPGRGLVGNPWIVEDIQSTLRGDEWIEPSLDERKAVCVRHLDYLVDFYGEKDGVLSMRRVLPRYFMGAVHATDLRTEMTYVFSKEDALCELDRLVQKGDQFIYRRG